MSRFLTALWSGVLLAAALGARAEDLPALSLAATAEVDGEGIQLSNVAKAADQSPLPVLTLRAAPAFGRTLVLTRADISNAVAKAAPELDQRPFTGADTVRITRRATTLDETALKTLLTGALQRDQVKDRGELELRLTRPWPILRVPDEPLTLNVLDLPTSGVTPSFIVRFELRTAHETLGTWQTAVQAKVLREVWVAREPLRRGQSLTEASLDRQRRDVMTVREPLFDWGDTAGQLDAAETIQTGATVFARSIRARPVVRRGQFADAVLQDGALSVSLKVEVLDEGAPGDFVRVRNPQTRRELRGKVINENLLAITI